MQLEHFELTFKLSDLVLVAVCHLLHLLVQILAVLSKLLILGQKSHSLLLSTFAALLGIGFRIFQLLHLIAHPSHNLLFNYSDVTVSQKSILIVADTAINGNALSEIDYAHTMIGC